MTRPGPPGTELHIGLATTLPPAPTGPAEFVAGALPELARACTITCFVDDPEAVDPAVRRQFPVRPLTERDDPAIDLIVYHIANNLHQIAIYDAAMAGPPGLLEIHDGSVHLTLATRLLASDDVESYRRLLARTHGPRGEQLAQLRLGGQPAGIELFMFDALLDLLDRHLGAVVHNRHAAEMLALRAPELPTWVVPLSAPPPAVAVSNESLGLPAGKLVIAHFGFVTRPKRPFLLLGAFARLRRVNPGVHLLFAGQDDTNGELTAEIERLDLAGEVTVTGYLAREEMDALISSVDIVVSLRFPHVGETSATLGAALAAGRPVAVQETGSWAELPESVVLRVAASGDEEAALAEALAGLVANPARRAQLGQAARTYARDTLGAEGYAVGIARAATAVSLGSRVPPARQLDERRSAVARFMAGGRDRLTTGTLIDAGWAGSGDPLPVHRTALAKIPPARSGGRLLDIGGGLALLRLLECVWGYQVVAGPADPGEPLAQPAGVFDVVTCWDLPAGHDEGADRLAEINRVLAPGGLMVLTTSSVGDLALRRLLPEAGLSDDELTCVDGREDPTTEPGPVVAVARKVGLPAAV